MTKKLTPMMAQYKQLKAEASDSLLLFRMGDFYEAFYEDAKLLADLCSVTLTKRADTPMSGVPWHSADGYIDRLTRAGVRVAIAEQVEAPKKGVALVKRKIVRYITPGTTTSSALLSERENHYIASVTKVGSLLGLSFLDVSTSEFTVMEFEESKSLLDELYRSKPREILTHQKVVEKEPSLFREGKEQLGICLTVREAHLFDHKSANALLTDHFKVSHLDGFGLKAMIPGINAAGALLSYIKEELLLPTEHIKTIAPHSSNRTLLLDKVTQSHLELTSAGGLLTFLDRCKTPMGARMLRSWVKQPLMSVEEITKRQEAIEKLVFMPTQAAKIKAELAKVRDLPRLMMKVAAYLAKASDLVQLQSSLEAILPLKELITSLRAPLFVELAGKLYDLSSLTTLLECALADEEERLFKVGYNKRLDELTALSENSKEVLLSYQEELRQKTGAKSLKVSFNKIFGYYIEVSKKQGYLLDASFQKKQTLVNNERYMTEQLKEIEEKLLSAEGERAALEKELFAELLMIINNDFSKILATSEALAKVDALLSLALVSYEYDWQRPVVDESEQLRIEDGMHPIVAAKLGQERFMPNSTKLDGEEARLMLLTGPNMAGKSTYIRQVALIVILAQVGSFVPAKSAHIGLVDQIFTRIGASDDLARGQSTFMVEMAECANILHNATNRSLVILDEVGRGTSTYDGLAIAWSIAEYLLLTEKRRAKTLFATHYFELTELEERQQGVVNYHAAVEELDEQITFMYKICKGSATRSYGIHVAKLAHLPPAVISRASEILAELEEKQHKKSWIPKSKVKSTPQLMLFNI